MASGTSTQLTIGASYLNVIPATSELSLPSISILKLTKEEEDRLGDGYSYTVQTHLKEVVEYTEETIIETGVENTLTNTLGSAETYPVWASQLTNLPNQFELTFQFNGTPSKESRLILTPTVEFTDDTHPEHYIYGGISADNTLDVGVRNITTDYTYGGTPSNTYDTFKIVRENEKTFKFYTNGTLIATKTAEWFNNYDSYELQLICWGTGTTCTVKTGATLIGYIYDEEYVRDWYKNFRVGVFNNSIGTPSIINYINADGETETIEYDETDYANLTVQEIFDNALYWSKPPTKVNEYTNIECAFMYNKDYPLYILICGDFTEANPPSVIQFTEPCIIETDNYKEPQKNGIFPTPFENMIAEDDTSLLQLEAYTQSNGLVFYDFPVDDDFGTTETMAIRGIEVTGNIEQASQQVVYAKLRSPSGQVGQRSIVINNVDTTIDGDNSFTIGGIGDLWGFGMLELTNLDQWSIELELSNIINDTVSNINFNDITVTFYVVTITEQSINIKIEGEDLSFYNAFITDVTIPVGIETDVDFLTIDGTDINDAYRQNIKEKVIEIEMEVGDTCDLTDNTSALRQLVKLITNTKDKYNRPIPKRIEFSYYPDVYFEYVVKDSPETNIDVSTYTLKAKLVIPSGTSYSKNRITTNVNGYVQGLTSVYPIITLTPTDKEISITETISGQTFQINYNTSWNGEIVEIDCEDMIVWLKQNIDDTKPLNITAYCDYNVDWFRLYGEYNFTSVNCVIRTVDYTQRE